jgi:DNA-binding NtrC family response regulator
VKDSEVAKAEIPGGDKIRNDTVSAPRILVVDDSNHLRRLCVKTLVKAGYEVASALDGAAGWEALQFNHYDLVITDNKMPKMTGMEMLEKLRSARMLLPVIMATGYLPTSLFAKEPWLQPDATLERPFSDDDLLETVNKVLRRDRNYNVDIRALLPH